MTIQKPTITTFKQYANSLKARIDSIEAQIETFFVKDPTVRFLAVYYLQWPNIADKFFQYDFSKKFTFTNQWGTQLSYVKRVWPIIPLTRFMNELQKEYETVKVQLADYEKIKARIEDKEINADKIDKMNFELKVVLIETLKKEAKVTGLEKEISELDARVSNNSLTLTQKESEYKSLLDIWSAIEKGTLGV